MKVKNLSKKAFIEPNTKAVIVPGSPTAQTLEGDVNVTYLETLERQGKIVIVEKSVETIEEAENVEESEAESEAEAEQDEEMTLADIYEQMTGKKPDGRWSEERIQDEIDNL